MSKNHKATKAMVIKEGGILMKKVVLIPDSFKGTMSSQEICLVMRDALTKHYPDCSVIPIPVADGGAGTVDAFLAIAGGEKIFKNVTGPFSDSIVEGYYAMLEGGVAVIEMCSAAGIALLEDRWDPSRATTYGVGELILDALDRGAKKIILGLGESATNDAACGLAASLGVSFYNAMGNTFTPVGATLDQIDMIDISTMDARLKNIPIVTICDVDIPFCGPDGAVASDAAIKGADPSMIISLESKMSRLAGILKRSSGVDVENLKGAGAAGGMGGGMAAMFSSELVSGVDAILDSVKFEELIKDADLILTGEGSFDAESLHGKVVIGVARRAKKLNKKVLAFVGDIGDSVEKAYDEGVTGIFSINRVAVSYLEARERAMDDLYLTVDNVLRCVKAFA